VIAPYTPQHNDISYKNNKTIVNMMRNMLKQKEISHCLWDEAATIVTYLIT